MARQKFQMSGHAAQRIQERSTLHPDAVLYYLNNGVAYEAHRQNGVGYFVLWSSRDKRPYLLVTGQGVVISFYYTYEYHRRRDECEILPAHIKLAKKACFDFFSRQNVPHYHIVATWEEVPGNTKRIRTKKLSSCSAAEFEAFNGTLLEFLYMKDEVFERLSAIILQPGCAATVFIRHTKGNKDIVASVQLAS